MTKRPYQQVFDIVRAELADKPAVRLRPEQLERLAGVDRSICQSVLNDLVRAGLLCTSASGSYQRLWTVT